MKLKIVLIEQNLLIKIQIIQIIKMKKIKVILILVKAIIIALQAMKI